MSRFRRFVVLGAVMALGLPIAGRAADSADPLVGTWQLDLTRSTFSPGPGPKGQLRTYERHGDTEKLTSRGIDASGKPNLVEYTARYDGKDYAITGSSGGDLISLKRIDPFTTESTQKRDGKAVIVARRAVSRDGKTLTVTTNGTLPKGETLDATMVFEKR